jgi:hypothetical protein
MKAAEFIILVRKMRTAQKIYYKLHPINDRMKKLEAMMASKQLEKQVDNADIDDLYNLVTEFPIA